MSRYVGPERGSGVMVLAGLICAVIAVESVLMEGVTQALMGVALFAKVMVVIGFVFPLGVLLGMFFPTGIRGIKAEGTDLVPWAFATNACATVVGTILAVVLAMSFGFRFVDCVAIGLYLVGSTARWIAMRRLSKSGREEKVIEKDLGTTPGVT